MFEGILYRSVLEEYIEFDEERCFQTDRLMEFEAKCMASLTRKITAVKDNNVEKKCWTGKEI